MKEPVRPHRGHLLSLASVVAIFLGITCEFSWAGDALTVKLHPSGMVEAIHGSTSLAVIDLNAHGAGWDYASQKDAKAKVSELPGKTGKRLEGSFEIPKAEGGAIRYTETVRPLSEGVHIEYDLVLTKTMKINGLQVSFSLPEAQYAGKEMLVSQLSGDPTLVGFPEEQAEGRSQVWTGSGSKVDLAKDTDESITIELRAATDVLVQDLRRWDSPFFEIRFPAITDQSGREIAAGTRFHLDLIVTFGAPVKLVGP